MLKVFYKFILNFIYLKKIENIINKRSLEITNDILKNYKSSKLTKVKIHPKKIKFDLSIVIPSYCKFKIKIKYLEYLLYRLSIAIKKAELENYEIIILDNNSIKNLKFLKKKFINLNLKIYRNKSTLPAFKNWSKAVNFCSGRYVYLHSDDDFVEKNFFDEIKNIVKKNYHDLITWKVKPFINNKSKSFAWYRQWPRVNSGTFKPDNKLFKYPIPSSGYIAKRKFYEKYGIIGSQDEGYDLVCGIKFSTFAKKGFFASKSISYYRMHSKQSSKIDDPSIGLSRLNYFIKSSNVFLKFFKKNNAKKKIFLYMKYYYYLHVGLDMFLSESNSNNKNKLGKFIFADFWVEKNFNLLNKILPRLNLKIISKKDIKISQPKYNFYKY